MVFSEKIYHIFREKKLQAVLIFLIFYFKEKEKLTKENAKIKQELESANAQITSLKEKMSTIKVNDTTPDNHSNIAKIDELNLIKDSDA